jgi:cytochrome c biogenesis protein CcmG/thiol:disulfide interchange protein DsbE
MFVGLDIQDAEDDARAYLKEFGVTYPNGRDEDGRISIDYGIVGMPATFFLDREGVVVGRWVGAIPEATLVRWVEALVAGVTPSGETEGSNPDAVRQLQP